MSAELCDRWLRRAVLLMAMLFGCSSGQPPDALVVYPDAKEVTFRQFGEIWQVYYEATAAYPADQVLNHIQGTLQQAGWKPLQNDFLNPYLPSSHQTGWDSYVDATTKPTMKVHQWLAQWQNAHGDVVFYALQYRYEAKATEKMDTVRVYGSHSPKRMAELQSKAANAPQPSNR